MSTNKQSKVTKVGTPDEHLEFTKRYIERYHDPKYSVGIHSVIPSTKAKEDGIGGYNQAFRKVFGGDPIKATTALIEAGKLEMHPANGGVMLYMAGTMPANHRGLVSSASKEDIMAKLGFK